LVVAATVVLAAEALFTAGALLAAQTRGTTAGLTSGVWTSHLLLVLRAIGIAAFAGVLGFSIAFGTRVTAAAVAVGFIYFAVLEQLLVVWKPWLGRYLRRGDASGRHRLVPPTRRHLANDPATTRAKPPDGCTMAAPATRGPGQ
jgi:hypothetical protein